MGSQDRRTGELQLAILLPSQQCPGNAAVVDLGAEKDELPLHHVLGLQPVLGRTAAVEAMARLETMPSRPSSAACLKNRAPSQSA